MASEPLLERPLEQQMQLSNLACYASAHNWHCRYTIAPELTSVLNTPWRPGLQAVCDMQQRHTALVVDVRAAPCCIRTGHAQPRCACKWCVKSSLTQVHVTLALANVGFAPNDKHGMLSYTQPGASLYSTAASAPHSEVATMHGQQFGPAL